VDIALVRLRDVVSLWFPAKAMPLLVVPEPSLREGDFTRRAAVFSRAALLSVAVGVPLLAQDTTRAQVATLSGQVVQPNGSPVAAAVLGLIGTGDTASTDDAGHFVIHASHSGAYMLSVRRLGFQPARIAVSLWAHDTTQTSITLMRVVPVLPTVTTTAAERAAYRSVGFEQRMEAGVGYFMTYDQIVKKEPHQFSDLFQDVPGLVVLSPPNPKQFGAAVTGRRGGPKCVSYVIDGNAQPMLIEHNAFGGAIGPESPDHLFDVDDLGAIEIYQPSERPAQFGSDWCDLVVIWTRTRLGIQPVASDAGNATTTSRREVIRGTPAMAADAGCTLPASSDTMDFPIYATLHTDIPRGLSRKAWARYTDSVLGVVQEWSVLPTQLPLATFGLPFVKDVDRPGTLFRTSPTMSSVIAFTLDSTGTLTSTRVAASALSGAADTSLIAMLARAAAAHAFPAVPRGPVTPASVQFDLLVSTTEPAEDVRRATLGRLEVPVWPLAQKAALLPDGSGASPSGRGGVSGLESVTVETAIDLAGHAVLPSARVLTLWGDVADAATDDDRARMARTLQALHFEPARIGACRVPELVIQPIVVPARDSTRP
jgi:hypothetical protein